MYAVKQSNSNHHPFFNALTYAERQLLIDAGREVTFRPKRSMVRAGEPATVLLVLEGAVRLVHGTDDGRELSVRIAMAPAIIGALESLAGRAQLESAVTLIKTRVLQVDAAIFEGMVRRRPELSLVLIQEIARGVEELSRAVQSVSFGSTEDRLVGLLRAYARHFGRAEGRTVTIEVALTQESLSRDLGIARKSVSRALNKLRQNHRVHKVRGRYSLHLEGFIAHKAGG